MYTFIHYTYHVMWVMSKGEGWGNLDECVFSKRIETEKCAFSCITSFGNDALPLIVETLPTAVVAGTRTICRRHRLVFAVASSCARPVHQVLQHFMVTKIFTPFFYYYII